MNLVNQVVRAMTWDFLGKGFLIVARFSESILLARLMGASDYGMLAIVLNFQTALVVITSLGIEGILARFCPQICLHGSKSQELGLIQYALKVQLIAMSLVSVFCFWIAGFLSEVFLQNHPHSELWLRLALLLFVLNGLHETMRRVLSIRFCQRLITFVEGITFSLYLAGAGIAVWLGAGITVILSLMLLSKFLLLATWAISKKHDFFATETCFNHSQTPQIYQHAFGFFVYILTLHALEKTGDALLLGMVSADAQEVTFYVLAFNFALFSSGFFQMALQGGFLPALVSETYQKQNFEGLQKIYTGALEYTYLLGLPIATGCWILAEDIILLLYGKEFLPAIFFLKLFFVHFAIRQIWTINSSFLLSIDRMKELILSRLFFLVFKVVLSLILMVNFQSQGVALATLLTGIGISLYETYRMRSFFLGGHSHLFLLKMMIAIFFMGFILVWIRPWIAPSPIYRIPILFISGIIIYGGIIAILKPVSRSYLGSFQPSSNFLKPFLYFFSS